MSGVPYSKPEQPQVGHFKDASHAGTSGTRLLMITDGRKGHSSDFDDDDDDFVDTPPKRQRTSSYFTPQMNGRKHT
jgi:hypothetical protein